MIDETIIQKWLVEENLLKNKIPDENSTFHYIINYPENHSMDIIQPLGKPDLILIGCATEIAQEQREQMKNSKKQEREDYIWDIRYTLNTQLLDFNLQIENNNELKQFIITDKIYEDGLNKNTFIKTIEKVFKSKIQCIWKLEQKFNLQETQDENNMYI